MYDMACRRFKVNDAVYTLWNIVQGHGAVCFEEDSFSFFQEPFHELASQLRLAHGFPAGQFDEIAVQLFDFIDDFFDE
jgi:hypothetical protein